MSMRQYGFGGFDPSLPHDNLEVEWDDDARVIRDYRSGALVEQPYTPAMEADLDARLAADAVLAERRATQASLASTLSALDEGAIRAAAQDVATVAGVVASDGRVSGTTRSLAEASISLATLTDQLAGLVPVARALADAAGVGGPQAAPVLPESSGAPEGGSEGASVA